MLSVIVTKLWLSAVVDTEDTVGAVVSEVLVVLSVVVVLSLVVVFSLVFEPSSLLLQEMTERLKKEIRKMYKIFFI